MSASMTQAGYTDVGALRRRRWMAQWTTGAVLFVLGLMLEVVYLALYPWLAGRTVTAQHDLVRQSWESFLPGLRQLYLYLDWTAYVQLLYRWPDYLRGHLYPLLLLLGLALLLVVLAARIGERGDRAFVDDILAGRPIFALLFILTCLFGLTMLGSPIYANPFTRDMFLSGLNGRMVVAYHLNPYLVHSLTLPVLQHDSLQQVLSSLTTSVHYPTPPFGPVWMDIGILVALIPHSDIAGTIFSFRLLNLLIHLINVLLLWSLLATLRPWQRIGATVLYAWNPLVLLLGISLAHQEMIIIMLVLLALLSIQHNATTLSWVVLLLAALINLTSLLLLPLFLFCLLRQTRFMGCLWRLSWSVGMLLVTALVVFMAYIPYWWGWGVRGIWQNLLHVFWQEDTLNSINTVMLALPLHLPEQIARYLQPSYWSLGVLALLACYLLVTFVLADTVDMTLLCGGWLLLLWLTLSPVYWSWYLLVPLIFAICAGNRKLTLCTLLLTCGAFLSWYYWQWRQPWILQGLMVVGIPCLLWGWSLFFSMVWRTLFGRDRYIDAAADSYDDEDLDDEDTFDDTTQQVYAPEDIPTRPAVVSRQMPRRRVNLNPDRF